MPEWLPPEIELFSDTSSADWVTSRLRPWDADGVRVASYMPDGFDRYARVFHPAGERGGDSKGLGWSEVATRLSRPFENDMQFRQLVSDGDLYNHPILGDIEPLAGSLPIGLLRSLVSFLELWTGDVEPCRFAMWDGNGSWWKGSHGGDDPFDADRDAVLRATPRVAGVSREYFLMGGPLQAVLPLFEAAGRQSPALWWPESRAWLVSTEVDAFSTYVGGSAALIEELLTTDGIEAAPSHLDAELDWGL
jgi:hypothetical protein